MKMKPLQLFDRPRILFLTAVALFVLSIAALSAALVVEHRDHALLYTPASSQHPFQPGQTIRMGAASVKLSAISYNVGAGSFSAPAGKHYLILDLTVKNFSDKPIRVLPSTDSYVKDASGAVYYLTPFGLERPFHAGELLPGEQVTGQLSYLVPKTAKLKFYVDGIWSGGVVPIEVKS